MHDLKYIDFKIQVGIYLCIYTQKCKLIHFFGTSRCHLKVSELQSALVDCTDLCVVINNWMLTLPIFNITNINLPIIHEDLAYGIQPISKWLRIVLHIICVILW